MTFKLERVLAFSSLVVLYVLAFVIRLFSVMRYGRVIHEFDPYFNLRATQYYISHGHSAFLNWFDTQSWYPLGRPVGVTVFPGLMYTAGFVHSLLNFLKVENEVLDVCVFISPWFASNTVIVTYLFAYEVEERTLTAILAAAFVALVPGYASRSVAGSFDNEGIAIFALMLTCYTWLKSIKTGSFSWSTACSLSYFYLVSSWGGYVFLTNLLPLHVITLILAGRFSLQLYISYSTFYLTGSLLAMQIPIVKFQPVQSSEHMLALGTFLFLQVYLFSQWVRFRVGDARFEALKRGLLPVVVVGAVAVFGGLYLSGKILPWAGRFYALLDPTYAKKHIPIIASVSEHQPATWSSLFLDLHLLLFLMPLGIYFCFQKLDDARIFAILFGVTSLYFTGIMVRLMLVLAPIACVLSAIAAGRVLSLYWGYMWQAPPDSGNKARKQISYLFFGFAIFLAFLYVIHCAWAISEIYSEPQIVTSMKNPDGSLEVYDDFREAYRWLETNTPADTKVLAWWDYGYQLTAIANRTVIVDNNTWNFTQISLVGQAFSLDEDQAILLLKKFDIDYVFITFGGVSGMPSDDLNKLMWMVRLGSETNPKLRQTDYLSSSGEFKVDTTAPPTLRNSLLYKLSYYKFGERLGEDGFGYDKVRKSTVGERVDTLKYFTEAFTSTHWIARLYKVKPRMAVT